MIHAGIGPTHVNALLTSMDIPPVSEGTLNRRRAEAGPAIEKVAKDSCHEALEQEKQMELHDETDDGTAEVNLCVSYDMQWGKRGKAHNSLTGMLKIKAVYSL